MSGDLQVSKRELVFKREKWNLVGIRAAGGAWEKVRYRSGNLAVAGGNLDLEFEM